MAQANVANTVKSYSLTGELYLAKSGWLLLHVPNDVGRGAYKALNEHGIELPAGPDGEPYNAHISVMRPEELEQIGGASRITERGKEFSYSLGHLREFAPKTWEGIEKCWALEVHSPDLEKLRKSYGLSAIPGDGKLKFHITVAVRRRGVLGANAITKAPGTPETPASASAPTFKIHDKPGIFLIKASGDACPACGGSLEDVRGKLVCNNCHRICEGCCEGSLLRCVNKSVYNTLEKKGFLKEAQFSDALYSLFEPTVRHWLNRQGYDMGQWNPNRNWHDLMESQRFTDMKNEAMRMAARQDSSPLKVLHGFNALLGGNWKPSALQDHTLQAGFAEIAPHIMRWSPEFWDQLHGGTGSVASLTAAIADAGRYKGITSAEAAQRAKGVFDAMYADPMLHRGFSAYQLGQIYREAAKRGLIGRDGDPQAIVENLAPVVGVASAIRDTTANSETPLTDMGSIFNEYDKVRAQYKGQPASAVESYIRTQQELGRQGGMMGAALHQNGGLNERTSLDRVNQLNSKLLENAQTSTVGRMAAVTARLKDEGFLKPGSPGEQFLERVRAGQVTNADTHQWTQMMSQSTDMPTGAVMQFLAGNTNDTQRYLTPDLVAGVRASQAAVDMQPQFDRIERSYSDAQDPTHLIRNLKRETFVNRTGYDDMNTYNALQGAAAHSIPGVMAQARETAERARQWSGYGMRSPVRRIIDTFKEPNPTPGSLLKNTLNVISAAPKSPELPKPPEPSQPLKMAAEKQAVGPGFQGIPNRNDMGDLGKLSPAEIVDLVIQRHDAIRAGTHRDLRIGDRDRGLYSWAMRAEGLPAPGQKVLANQQPLHAHAYGAFQGTLGPGYGQGTVRREKKGRILITQASPTKIEFTTADTATPERFVLFKPGGNFGARQWLLMNNTPTEGPPGEKPHFKVIPSEQVEPMIAQMQAGTSVQAKVDGAHSLVKLMKGGVEVLSYRKSKRTDAPIFHTERVFGGRPKIDYPKQLEGTTLRGETYGRDAKGHALPPHATGGLLNSTIENSLKTQHATGQDLHNQLFDAATRGKQELDPAAVPYAERRKIIDEVLPYLPQGTFDAPQEETTPAGAKHLWKQIASGKHPLTHEGIVIHPPVGQPTKAKLFQEHDVHITGSFPGKGKYQGRGVGGLTYALQPDGPTVGEIGSGLSDDMRMRVFANPQEYVGRVARIRAQAQHASGAYRMPALVALHEDY